MKLRLQFGGLLLALGISAGMALPSAAQKREANKPPQERQQPRQAPRQERRQERPNVGRIPSGRPSADRPHNAAPANRPTESMSTFGGNRPPNANIRGDGQRPDFNPNRPPNAVNRPRNLSPEERQRLQQDERRFRQLPPQQQQEMRERARVWGQLTQQQREHIRNDVLPKWQQMPPDRQRAIRQRLGVLQNMPEYARNQHLNDPNFTRGMSEEDKAMLRDLSHMHVGAPDQPNE
jgi:uncharacterized protein DUF3106